MKNAPQLILVAVKGEHHQPILGPAIAEIIQTAKTRLKSNYKGWILQVRTPQGYKNVPVLRKAANGLGSTRRKERVKNSQLEFFGNKGLSGSG